MSIAAKNARAAESVQSEIQSDPFAAFNRWSDQLDELERDWSAYKVRLAATARRIDEARK